MNNLIDSNSIESILKRSFPEKSEEIASILDKFKENSGDIISMNHSLKELLGPEGFSEFINKNFRSYSPALMIKSSIRTLKANPENELVAPFVEKIQGDFKCEWTCHPSKLGMRALMSEAMPNLIYSIKKHLYCLTNQGAYTLSMKNFVFKKFNYSGQIPIVCGHRWMRILNSNQSMSGSNPLPLEGHSSTLISHSEVMLFGGGNSEYKSNDTYILDLNCMYWYLAENDPSGDLPCPRDFHTAVSVSNTVYVFGGSDTNEDDCDDLYYTEIESYPIDPEEVEDDSEEKKYIVKWNKVVAVNHGPEPRFGHSCEVIQNRFLIIIGGCKRVEKSENSEERKTPSHSFDEDNDSTNFEYAYYQFPIWAFDLITLTWTKIIPHNYDIFVPRSFHVSCHDSTNHNIFIFGGRNDQGAIDEREVYQLSFKDIQMKTDPDQIKLYEEIKESLKSQVKTNYLPRPKRLLRSDTKKGREEQKECLKDKIINKLEAIQFKQNKEILDIGPNSEVLFLTEQSQADTLGVSEKERYVFTIQKNSQKIILANNIRDGLHYQEQTGENADFQSFDGNIEFKSQESSEDVVSNQLLIVKNFDSVSQTLLELAKKYQEQCPEGEEILISAYRILPNNHAEKPVYDRDSCNESDGDSCQRKRLRDENGPIETPVKRFKLSDDENQ
ncbi:unnamed protein product [Moneuplotes crassus]|uniref:Uncharacterized protein n=1 Tax=Euplotes crassus TaxID=5936 RepID=A0AAD1X6A8_EUPCR|nr:unnamed protein product [Moneuplotes crassus]